MNVIKYEVMKRKNKAIWLEVEEQGWANLVEETKLPKGGAWDRFAIRVPVEGLRKALSQVTIQHEVGRTIP